MGLCCAGGKKTVGPGVALAVCKRLVDFHLRAQWSENVKVNVNSRFI